MIKKLNRDDIISLLDFEHDISDVINCSIGEWVQLLMGIVDKEQFLMLGTYDKSLTGYIILRNNISPPVSNTVRVVFAYLENTSSLDMEEIIKATTNWTKLLGANSIIASCRKSNRYSKYGFTETGMIGMELKV